MTRCTTVILGRKYASDLDQLIVDLLDEENKPIPYGKLYEGIHSVRKALSYETFNTHLKVLRRSGLIELSTGYHLTQKTYRLKRLKILEFRRSDQTALPTESEEQRRLKVYFILLWYANRSSRWNKLETNEQFEHFLSKYHLSIKDLELFSEYDLNNKFFNGHIKEFRPDPVYGITIRIWQHISSGKVSHSYLLPGFSIPEIISDNYNRTEFWYVNPTRTELKNAVDAFLNEGMLERINEFDGEMRYKFPDYGLRDLMSQCKDLQDEVYSIILGICEYIREPNGEEKKWLETFYGASSRVSSVVDEHLLELRHDRRNYKRQYQSKISSIKQLMANTHTSFENFMDSDANIIKKYVVVGKLLEYIYPPYMRRSFSSSNVYAN